MDASDMVIETNIDEIGSNHPPLFSILVMCYKNTALLNKMLDTIFMQDYPRIQLIVSDDGSRDFDVDKVNAYIDENKNENIEEYLVLKNSVNIGTVKHVHKVLPEVKGEFLILTAADDRFAHSSVVSEYVHTFQANLDAKWIVARCAVTTDDYKRTIYVAPTDTDEEFFLSRSAQSLFSRWSRRCLAVPCSMAFKREAFDLVGGIDLEYRFIEDWPLVLKLLRNGYAPIYLDMIVAYHSAGGVTNTNKRYGIEVRKAFYDDKYLIFRKEVNPYEALLSEEDKKCKKIYIREIMDRNYFLDIEFYPASGFNKIKAMFKSPRKFFWVFEVLFSKYFDRFPRKKALAISNVLLVFSCMLLQFRGARFFEAFFELAGILDLVLSLLLFAFVCITLPLQRYYKCKVIKRRNLVN